MKDRKDYTKGSIIGSLISLAVPIVLTNLLHSAYQLTDTFWVGRLGANAVAAVSLSFPVIFLLMTLGGGFSLAGTILVAQYRGRKDQENVNYVTSQTILIMFFVSVVISLIGYIVAPGAMKLIGAAPEILPDAVSYLRISTLGMIFMFSFFVFQSLMRGVGEVYLPMRIVAFTVVLNLILDPLFIMGYGPFPAHGVTGAALATISTQAISSIIGIWILLRGRHGVKLLPSKMRFDGQLLKRMFLLGLPASIEQSMKSLGLMMISFLVAGFGTIVVASYGIGIRMLSLVIIPAFGLSMATSTLVGQNMGAGKPNRAEKIANKSATIGFTVLLALGVLSFIGAPWFAAAFIPGEPEVIAGATLLIRFLSINFPFLGASLVFNGALQGAGNTRIPMVLSIVSLWVFEFPLAYVLSHHTSLNEVGIWMASPIAAILSAFVGFTYFRMGRWKKIKLIETPQQHLEDEVLKEAQIEEGI